MKKNELKTFLRKKMKNEQKKKKKKEKRSLCCKWSWLLLFFKQRINVLLLKIIKKKIRKMSFQLTSYNTFSNKSA